MKKTILSLFVSILYFVTNGQNFCYDSVNLEKLDEIHNILAQNLDKNYNESLPMIRLALHNVRRNDGTGGNSWAEIDNLILGLPSFYEEHGICFTVVQRNEIHNTSYFNLKRFSGNLTWEELIATDRVSNAINIYFVKDADRGGATTGFLYNGTTSFSTITFSNTLYGGGVSIFFPAGLAHELGHALGLLHTHEGTEVGSTHCREFINGSNCATCGDKICDTPADPNLNFGINTLFESSCIYNRQGNYNPDTRNIMSYTDVELCMSTFTPQQVALMRSNLLNTTDLDNYVIRENITITGTYNDDRYYGTENTITSSINHTSGEVTYEAANEVKLQNGFKITADANTSFHAKLGTYSCIEPLETNYGEITPINDNTIRGVNFLPSEKLNFSMFPNPTTGSFTMNVFVANNQQVEILMTDLTGKRMLTQQKKLVGGTNEQFEIDVSVFNRGIYFVTVKTNKEVKTQKLVIE